MVNKKNVTYLGMDNKLIELEEDILMTGRENPEKLKEIDFSSLLNK